MHGRWLAFLLVFFVPVAATAPRTHKPPLHGQTWMAVTGKPTLVQVHSSAQAV